MARWMSFRKLLDVSKKRAYSAMRDDVERILFHEGHDSSRRGGLGRADLRWLTNASTHTPPPRLKRESRRRMLTFFVLLAAFACVLTWIYFLLFRSV